LKSEGELSTKKKWAWTYSIVVWLAMVLYVAPLLIANNWWDPLDVLPYWLCLGVGVGGAVLGFRLWRDAQPNPVRLFVLAWTPMLAIALGLASNVYLDTSPPIPHATRFLGFASRQKGPMQARFASWREGATEERITCSALRIDAFCAGLTDQRKVVVTTRRGALGWEWIEAIAPASLD
jgi:hypothetical protein